MRTILVTGALGQIGSELVPALRERNGVERVVASDIREPEGAVEPGAFEIVDCTDADRLRQVVADHDVGTIYHLAALLSAVAEERPQRAWSVNVGGLYNVLEAARERDCAVFHPSSIAAFGPSTPKVETPQVTIQRPTSMYGISKVSGELLCDYYHRRWDVDVRGLRFPGIISHRTPPGGGTTDYAVHIFHEAIRDGAYTCFLEADTRLDMMYMPDAVRAAIELMDADPSALRHRNAYNVSAMNFTPAEIAEEIGRRVPGFGIRYEVDPVRQSIADSWPSSLDDSAAREEWGWRPEYDLERMTEEMLEALRTRLETV